MTTSSWHNLQRHPSVASTLGLSEAPPNNGARASEPIAPRQIRIIRAIDGRSQTKAKPAGGRKKSRVQDLEKLD